MYSITYLESIPSTNDELLARIRAGVAVPGEVIVAREQTRGRGRMGRQWSSAVGGLWFTAAMPLHGEHLGWAGMLAALGVCGALEEIGLRAGVKWPNDVVVAGKKLAGVLVEMVAGRELAAVGVGLNVRNALPALDAVPRAEPRVYTGSNPAEAGWSEGGSPSTDLDEPKGVSSDQSGAAACPEGAAEGSRGCEPPVLVHPGSLWPPTSVSLETGRDLDPWSLLEPILARMSDLWRTWQASRLSEMQDAWSARDVSRGHWVKLLPDGPEGVAAGIDLTGALRVCLPDGRETHARAGELAFIDREGRGL